ncbi:hypothetical protein Tsubulata_035060 [Turnera subulata]|uniref:RING-type E3 ubiquitin transferase n=1 Tax=Turnera subulata TaxID=218843 RepID=A0A9Q0FX96_9ROSI|nr:hypothetical protein Tsubulata_035060 [Turnera subulata]
MADTPPQSPSPAAAVATDRSSSSSSSSSCYYWCYHCNKRVSVESPPNLPDVICRECKNGFVECYPAPSSTTTQPYATPSLTSDPSSAVADADDDSSFGAQFLQMLRIIAQAGHDEDAPPLPPPRPNDPQSDDDFLRIELDGWQNEDEDDDEEDDNDESNRNEGEDRSDNENEDGRGEEGEGEEEEEEEEDEEEMRRRRREMLRLRIRDFATRASSGRNRILDWAEILMGLDDNSIEFRWEVPDRYIGNPEDYVDAAGYEALLQNLADNDSSGRRGAPPASKSSVSALPKVVVASEEETVVCAICKDTVNVGEMEMRLPCGHGYHGDCIVPWLGSRNSCPVCRFELPTDDEEYEQEKKKKSAEATVAGGASGSGGNYGNSSSS